MSTVGTGAGEGIALDSEASTALPNDDRSPSRTGLVPTIDTELRKEHLSNESTGLVSSADPGASQSRFRNPRLREYSLDTQTSDSPTSVAASTANALEDGEEEEERYRESPELSTHVLPTSSIPIRSVRTDSRAQHSRSNTQDSHSSRDMNTSRRSPPAPAPPSSDSGSEEAEDSEEDCASETDSPAVTAVAYSSQPSTASATRQSSIRARPPANDVAPIKAGQIVKEGESTTLQPLPLVELADSDSVPLSVLQSTVRQVGSTNGTSPHLAQQAGMTRSQSSYSSHEPIQDNFHQRPDIDAAEALARKASIASGRTSYHLARSRSIISSAGGSHQQHDMSERTRSSNGALEGGLPVLPTSNGMPQTPSKSAGMQAPRSPHSPRVPQYRSRGESAARSNGDHSASSIGYARRVSTDSNGPLAIASSTSAQPSHAHHDASQTSRSAMRAVPEAKDSAQAGPSASGTARHSPSSGKEKERETEVGRNGSQREKERTSRRQLGEWTLGKTLGAGSMGKVKLGVSNITGDKLAIKIVPRFTSTAAAHQQAAAQAARDAESGATGQLSRKSTTNGRSGSASGASSSDPKLLNPTAKEPSQSFLAKAYAKDLSKEVRTIREASIVLLLHHPYITGMRSMLVYPNYYYMVFEYINGGQMLDYIISHGRLRERSARKFARQISSALEYCHANSIVHRDLKIENILISKGGNIKIIDFGLSNLFSPHSHLSTFCGSLYFAAPELLNAKVYTGPEVDIWSFGIVLYVLVCGKVPFDDQSMPALHAKIKRGLVEYPAWLSAECKHLLSRMLVTNPANRATLQEVASHPWMTKGYDGAPNSHLPPREPVRHGELDPEVIKGMTGFEFGTVEEIESKLGEVLTSDTYTAALTHWDEKRGRSATSMRTPSQERLGSMSPTETQSVTKSRSPSKRFSGLGFYGKKIAGNMAAAFSSKTEDQQETGLATNGKSTIAHTVGAGGVRTDLTDPTRGYHPLLSIYFLVKEKIEREKLYGAGVFASSTVSLTGPPPTINQEPAQKSDSIALPKPEVSAGLTPPLVSLAAPAPAATFGSRDTRVLQPPTARARPVDLNDTGPFGGLARPSPAAGESTVLGRTGSQQRARRSPALPTSTPASPPAMQGGFRRTAAPDPEPQRRPSHSSTPPVHRHSIHLSGMSAPQSSIPAVMQPNGNEGTPVLAEELPSSPTSTVGSGFVKRFGSILTRSDDKKHSRQRNSISVSSTFREKQAGLDSDIPLSPPPAGKTVGRASTTGADLSPSQVKHLRGASVDTAGPGAGLSASSARNTPPQGDRRRQASLSMNAGSPRRPKTTGSVALPDGQLSEEPENALEMNEAGIDTADGNVASDSKPVYLKGLFSVATTSTKSPAVIRESIVSVLDRLNVTHQPIKAGFECAHAPSIDLTSVAFSPRPDQTGDRGSSLSTSPESPTLGRRRSSRRTGRIGLPRSPFSKDKDLDREAAADLSQASLSNNPRTAASSTSFTMLTNPPTSAGEAASPALPPSPSFRSGLGQPAQPATDVSLPQDANDMVVRFEVFIIKVPWLPGLHGIQFRRISGSAWQYSQLARTILNELKL